ncbi:MAG: hypothetical protein AAB316_20520 [Bacteroidota bacterium]|mgnify:CR=1 FL=1
MKNQLISLILCCFCLNAALAQLKLQSVSGDKTVEIDFGRTVTFKLPTTTSDTDCECGHAFKGNLREMKGDQAMLVLEEHVRTCKDENGVNKKVETIHVHRSGEFVTAVPLKNLKSVTRHSRSSEGLTNMGGILMLLTIFQGMVVAPLLDDDARRVSDKIMVGGFGLGLTLVALPKKRTWHFEQPKGKVKRLWRLATD